MSEQELYLPDADESARLSSGGPAISVKHLSKAYGSHRILNDISFDLERGKIYTLIGPSGGGKSTLLKSMIGAEAPDAGKVFIDGIDLWSGEEHTLDKARRKFGVLFQNSALLNHLSCGENVALPLRQHTNLPASTIEVMVRMKLELVGMGEAIDTMPNNLSGGMKKRCALARAIALDPAIVFFDEPSAGIDPVMISVLDRLILDLTEKLGITSVVITHEMPSAFRISDEMLMLLGGKLHFRGTPAQVRASTDPALRQFIHGDEHGPLSQASSRQAVAARILGIPEQIAAQDIQRIHRERDAEAQERARAAEERMQQAAERERIERERERSKRFSLGQSVVLQLDNQDTRERRTMRMTKADLQKRLEEKGP